ncbi:MAG: substrate-binding domain-containing protein [Pirellulales bacterium]
MTARALLALFTALALAGCNRKEDTGDAKLQIVVIPKGTTHDFWKSVHAGAKQAGDELGVEVIWKGPASEKDKEGQIKIVEGFVASRGADGIALAPIDRSALVRPVLDAKRKNIPTVIFDSGLDETESIVSYVATNNYHGGEMGAHHLAKLLGGEGDVILLRYAAGSESTEERERGFVETLQKHYPKIRMLSDKERVGSDAAAALRKSESLLIAHKGAVDGVFTVCEPNNKGMLRALENAPWSKDVKFVGFDSDPRFVQALRDRRMHGIVLQDPVKMGYLAVKTLVLHLRGEKVEKLITTGEYLATPDNMDEPRMKELLAPKQID